MKKLIVFLILAISLQAYCQCGVYLTFEDYQQGKLTDEGSSIGIPSGPGEDNKVAVVTAHGRKVHLWSDIWGYKDYLSEYRILYDQPMLIVCKGAISAYTTYGTIKRTGQNTVVYNRRIDGFGEVYIGTDMKSPDGAVSVTDYMQLWPMMDTSLLTKVKAFYVRQTEANDALGAIPEQIINYYNSLKPGYVAPVYDKIKVRTAKEREEK